MARKQDVTENSRLKQELEVVKTENNVLENEVITHQDIIHSLLAQNNILVGRLVGEIEKRSITHT